MILPKSRRVLKYYNKFFKFLKKASRRSKLATQGYSLDNTVLDNYVVLYKSYQGEDDSQAKVWLMKYLMNSPYGVTESKKLLAEVGAWASEAKQDLVRVSSGVYISSYDDSEDFDDPNYSHEHLINIKIEKSELNPPELRENAKYWEFCGFSAVPRSSVDEDFINLVKQRINMSNIIEAEEDQIGIPSVGNYYIQIIFYDDKKNYLGFYQTPEPVEIK